MKLFLMALAFVFSLNFALACPCKKASMGCPECGKVTMKESTEYEGKEIKAKTYPCEKCAKNMEENPQKKGKVE